MVSENTINMLEKQKVLVLILIVVEYGLGERCIRTKKKTKRVLILIVVEYGLGVNSKTK